MNRNPSFAGELRYVLRHSEDPAGGVRAVLVLQQAIHVPLTDVLEWQDIPVGEEH